MISENTKVVEITSNVTYADTVKSEIDAESMPHIMNLLTHMYQDAYLAIAREYISNAIDAVLASKGVESAFGVVFENPVEVVLPTRANPTFIIRDHGIGMSLDVMKNIYPHYGRSTKRATNAQIGHFGIGAKSAFTTVTNFIVTSIHEGKKNVLVFQKDENGVGEANFMDEQDTTEANGTTITMLLPDPDRLNRVFSDSNLLLGFPAGSISINGVVHTNSVYSTDTFTQLDDAGWVLNSLVDWENSQRARLRKNWNEKIVLVGPISYTFDKNLLEFSEYRREFGSMDDFTVVNLPIGSVDVTPARDTLIFSDKTRNAIVEATRKMKQKLDSHVGNLFDNAGSRREAVTIADSIRSAGFRGEWKYQDEVIPDYEVKAVANKDNWYTASGHKNSMRGFYQGRADNTIVVYGVPDIYDARNLNRFRKAFEIKHPNITDSFRLVYTSAQLAELNPWTEDIAVAIYSVAQFEELGQQFRTEINAEKRAQRMVAGNANGGANVNYGALPVSVLKQGDYDNNRPKSTSYYSADVADRYDAVVYMRVDENAPATPSTRFARIATTNATASNDDYRSLNAVIRLIQQHFVPEQTVAIVRIPNNTRVESFLNAVPRAVSIDDALAVAVEHAKESSTVSVDMLSMHRAGSRHVFGWVDGLDVEDINNEGVRAWVRAAQNFTRLNYSARQDVDKFNRLTTVDVLAPFFTELNEQVEAFEHYRLPLLEDMHTSRYISAEVVEYVNFKYPA
jgi:hypothetical protein